MKNFDIEVSVKDLDKLFNDMQDKAIIGSENVATASWVIKQQQAEIETLKQQVEMLSRAFETVCDGMETSLELNKAQAERYWSEKK